MNQNSVSIIAMHLYYGIEYMINLVRCIWMAHESSGRLMVCFYGWRILEVLVPPSGQHHNWVAELQTWNLTCNSKQPAFLFPPSIILQNKEKIMFSHCQGAQPHRINELVSTEQRRLASKIFHIFVQLKNIKPNGWYFLIIYSCKSSTHRYISTSVKVLHVFSVKQVQPA